MKLIELTKGFYARIDDEDLEEVNKFTWRVKQVGRNLYAITGKAGKNLVYMHRFLLGLRKGDGIEIDHFDGDGTNNQKDNLRVCTHLENMRNAKKRKDNTSGFKGVSWNKDRKKWIAQISINKKHIRIGRFKTKERAYQAYCERAKREFGDFARLA